MRKLLKGLFSQVVIVSLLLIVQLAVMFLYLMRISEYFIYVDISLRLISLITVVIIINRHSNPSYKLAWIIPILIFPLFGGLFYLLITGQMRTKRFFNKLSSLEQEINKKDPQEHSILREISEKFPERASTVKYINNTSKMVALRNYETKYFPVGEDMFITSNFILGADSLTFLYNRYEIAPYAMGDRLISLNYETLKEILK